MAWPQFGYVVRRAAPWMIHPHRCCDDCGRVRDRLVRLARGSSGPGHLTTPYQSAERLVRQNSAYVW